MKKSYLNFPLVILFLAFTMVFTSCDEEDEAQPTPPVEETLSIVETAVATDDFSSLVAALTKADLVSALNGDGPFTVFAPTNAAFNSFLSDNGFASLDEVPNDVLTQVLLNHVVSGKVMSTDLAQGYVSTLAKEATTENPISLYVDLMDGVKLNGMSMVSTADVEATNGVIHIVDAVIGVPTVVDAALANEDFSILVSALTRSDLTTNYVEILTGSGPFTVFAPNNAAFAELLDSNEDWSSLDDIPVATLEAVLNYHVVAGANVLSSALTDKQEVEALGGKFMINLDGSGASITDAIDRISNIIATDVQNGNGVIHVIDKVILPEGEKASNSIVDIALDDENFSSLVAALQKAELVNTLMGDGPFTVFAPTNEAFAAFLSDNGFAGLDDVPTDVLTQVLLNHVVSGEAKSTDLVTGYISTLAEESTTENTISLYVDLTDGVRLNGVASVSIPDVIADNGVVHVIDAVIGVPSVVTHALSNPNFSILVAALTRSDHTTDYVGVLTGEGPFTVFAPTNDAFAALLDSNDSWNSLDDIPLATLEAVLNYHVVSGANVLSNTLTNGQEVESLGGMFKINLDGSEASITDANDRISKIIALDVQGGNGIIHAIDQVILP
jgi:transforming growth factor-beta-induced protein